MYKPTGEALREGDRYTDFEYNYAPSATVGFTGRESATRANIMGISYTNRR
ncbi:hypothetical protein [Fibrella arboris]|uniref:hypothetical protein n=1 Tax=Fibrella arboris TaxID=3242486 RepID=UPI0035217FDD